MALMALGGLLTGATHHYATFFVGRLISGVGAVLLNVLLTKMATDWFVGRELGTALALLGTSWPIGIGIALTALPRLATAISTAAAFATTAAVSALTLVLLAAIYRVPNAVPRLPRADRTSRLSLRELALVSLAGGVFMLFSVGYNVCVSFSPLLLIARGFSPEEAGFTTSLSSWTIIAAITLGGLLIDRIGYATVLMSASFALFGLAAMLLPSSPTALLIAFIGVVAGLPYGGMMTLPAAVLQARTRGAGMGVFFTWYFAGMTLLTPVAGILRDATGDPGSPLLFAGWLEIATLGVLILFRLLQHRYKIPS
jgi:MFS family permease